MSKESTGEPTGQATMGKFHHSLPMTRQFEEIDYRKTALGELSLRRKRMRMVGDQVVFEVKLGEDFLMSSLFTAAEKAVADMGLPEVKIPGPFDVVVGGLGLGYTAVAALENPNVGSLIVVEYLKPVIEWHQESLVPLGEVLTGDARCRLVHADFFGLAKNPAAGFDPEQPGRRFHAILLDIDHTPNFLLHASHGDFYRPAGLRKMAAQLHPGGVFAMWSDGGTDTRFLTSLQTVFPDAEARRVSFHNPLQDCESSSTVYVARKGRDDQTNNKTSTV